MSILFISGSPSHLPSRSGALADYVGSRVRAVSVTTERLSVLDIPADDLVHVRRQSEAAATLRQAVVRSDAIVIATPIYNASVPGGLKALLDLLPQRALHGKIVLPLASGGSAGHQLAIEYSLKPVLSALGGRHVLAGVFACEHDVEWRPDTPADPLLLEALTGRLDEATDLLLTLLGVPLVDRRSQPNGAALQGLPGASTSIPLRPSNRERCSA